MQIPINHGKYERRKFCLGGGRKYLFSAKGNVRIEWVNDFGLEILVLLPQILPHIWRVCYRSHFVVSRMSF